MDANAPVGTTPADFLKFGTGSALYLTIDADPPTAQFSNPGYVRPGVTQVVGVDSEAHIADDSRPRQSLHASWNADTLRLIWSGASWRSEGDLFVYLNTDGGGATELYDPYPLDGATYTFGVNAPPATAPIYLPAGFAARYLLWVRNDQIVTLRATASGALQLSSPATVVLGNVAGGISGTVQFVGTINSGLNPRSAELDVTVSDELHGDFDWLWMQVPVDSRGPVLEITAPQGYAPTAPSQISGNGSDDSAIASVRVEVTNVPGGGRILAYGAPAADGSWSCDWTPGDLTGVSEVHLRAQGTDAFGNVGDWSPVLVLTADTTPPIVEVEPFVEEYLTDGFLNGAELFWRGRMVGDGQPKGLATCQDRLFSSDCLGTLLYGVGVAPWRANFASEWSGEDDVAHTLALYGQDDAGNRSTLPFSRTFVVDTVSPVVTVTTPISTFFTISVHGADAAMAGAITDGGGIDRMRALLLTPDGQFRVEDVTVDGTVWNYRPQIDSPGDYLLLLVAWDRAGNSSFTRTYQLRVACLEATGIETLVAVEPANEALDAAIITATLTRTSGGALAPGIPVRFTVNGASAGVLTTTQPLAVGQSLVLTQTWPISATGDYDIVVEVDRDEAGAGILGLCSEASGSAGVSVQDLPLGDRWNLVSTRITHFDTDIQVVAGTIADDYFSIQSFDGEALAYYPYLAPELNTLETLDALHGYWILTQNSQPFTPTLRIWGEKLAPDAPIALQAGWNLVSYLPEIPLPIGDALASIAGKYTAVLAFDDAALSFYPDLDARTNTLHQMSPGFGYWIKASEPVTLIYPAALLAAVSLSASLPEVAQAELEASAQVTATNRWMNFYGLAATFDGTALPAGTTVLAIDPDGGGLWGSRNSAGGPLRSAGLLCG